MQKDSLKPVDAAIEIALKKYPKAKKIALENFVWSSGDNKMSNNINLNADTRTYKWNSQTVNAIRMALKYLDKA